MKATIEFVAQLGGLALIFTIVWAFIRFTGYGKFYDKMMFDDDETTKLTFKNNKEDDIGENDDNIQHLSV